MSDKDKLRRVAAVDSLLTAPEGTRQELISCEEIAVLKRILERDVTARISHGGLRGLLSLNHDDAEVLLAFLRRI